MTVKELYEITSKLVEDGVGDMEVWVVDRDYGPGGAGEARVTRYDEYPYSYDGHFPLPLPVLEIS